MRAFIAFPLPEPVRKTLSEVSRELSREVSGRFVGEDAFHITVAFLGDIDEETCTHVTDVMDEVCAGAESFDVICSDLKFFGRRDSATLWAGVESAQKMARLAEKLRSGLRAGFVGFDRKPFLPHVTLARRADLADVDLTVFSRSVSGRVDQVVLFRSDLSAEGARYAPLHTVELG